MSEDPNKSQDSSGEFDWFDKPKSRRFLWKLLIGACVLFAVLEIPLFIAHKRHSHFNPEENPTFDGWLFFYALLGFIGCSLMILAAKGLGKWLKRPADHYGSNEDEPLPDDVDESLR
ncbi:MAG: hypothetical protein HKN23_14905 [Verrucomicrobiales bacterium]|nr:hypothetical protein [Verrucomicrobiales bacterium]